MRFASSRRVVLVAACVIGALVAQTATATESATGSDVEKQLRLMEQRMTEMEDRLQATTAALEAAKSQVDEQQEKLSEAGLVEGEERGVRSGVGHFVDLVEVSGVFASSFNYRFLDPADNNRNVFGSFRHPNADTFQIDQAWITLDKTPTEESRGGFHADYVWGETAQVQGGNRDSGLIYTAYVSYLAPVGTGVQVDAGRLPKVLGAESMQTNQNFNISQGLLFQLQPNATTGVQASTEVADGLVLTAGVVNDVFRASNVDTSRDKAYYGKVSFVQDRFGFDVGAIWGKDDTVVNDTTGLTCDSGDDCFTSVFDVVARAYPTDAIQLWIDYTWARTHGNDTSDGDVQGIAGAGRLAVTEDTGVATRVEYVRADRTFVRAHSIGTTMPVGPFGAVSSPGGTTGSSQIVSWTTTVDHRLAEGLKLRGEVRWDRNLSDDSTIFASGGGANQFSDRTDQVTGLAEIFYEF